MRLFQEYVEFLLAHNYPIEIHQNAMDKYEKYGIVVPGIDNKIKTDKNKFTTDECRESNKILLYTGYLKEKWNYTSSLSNPVGGSETAVSYLTKHLSENIPTDYELYVGGDGVFVNISDTMNLYNNVINMDSNVSIRLITQKNKIKKKKV